MKNRIVSKYLSIIYLLTTTGQITTWQRRPLRDTTLFKTPMRHTDIRCLPLGCTRKDVVPLLWYRCQKWITWNNRERTEDKPKLGIIPHNQPYSLQTADNLKNNEAEDCFILGYRDMRTKCNAWLWTGSWAKEIKSYKARYWNSGKIGRRTVDESHQHRCWASNWDRCAVVVWEHITALRGSSLFTGAVVQKKCNYGKQMTKQMKLHVNNWWI